MTADHDKLLRAIKNPHMRALALAQVHRESLRLHPACAVWPQMTEPELDALAATIKQSGLLVPIIVMPNGAILDGKNRWLACQRAGIAPRTVVYEGDDPIGLFWSLNVLRRHAPEDEKENEE
jgi:ParB-like chromosome segregation protein Spo0J